MRRSFVESNVEVARIDVTPVIGVALVLVLILLITAPLFPVVDLGITPPEARTRGTEDARRVTVTMGVDGALAVDDRIVRVDRFEEEVARALRLQSDGDARPLVIIRADTASDHEVVQGVLRRVKAAGAERVAIGTLQRTSS